MKKLFLILLLALAISSISSACEITFAIKGNDKQNYKAGDEVIVQVTIVYTHRRCELEPSDTKFTYSGLKVLGASKWEAKNEGTFSRQIKVKLLDDNNKEAVIKAIRDCNKDGGSGSISIAKS